MLMATVILMFFPLLLMMIKSPGMRTTEMRILNPHTITTSADGAHSVYAVDVDGDGDIDVLSSSFNDDKIAWYENLSPVGIVNNDTRIIPDEYKLFSNYPNPFNPSTIIRFSIPEESFVTIKVFNTLGEEITTLINENINAGNYEVEFSAKGGSASGGDAYSLPSGIYFYQVRAGSFVETKKMMLLK